MGIFLSMAEAIPEGGIGLAKVEHFEVSDMESRFSAIRGGMDWVPEGKYARLLVGSRLVMSDTRMEHVTNLEAVRNAKGNALIAGLGLGTILHPILAKESVSHVTVVEKYADVIALIKPTLPQEKLTIVCADIYEWKPTKGTKFDTIYFDIWADQSTDDLEGMRKLHCRFRPYKVKGGWMDSWRRDWLRSAKRRNRW